MSRLIGSPNGGCECWAPVLGTMLILLGVFDLAFGAAITALTINLAEVAGEIESKSALITLGGGLSQFSGGLISLGGAAEGAAAKAVLGDLPPIWLSMVLSIGRVLIAAASIILGIGLAKRLRSSLTPLIRWAIITACWGALTILMTIGVYQFIAEVTGGLAAFITVMMDIGLHIAWPLVVLVRVRRGR